MNHLKPLGRNEPADYKHVELFPAKAMLSTLAKPSPVIAGAPWSASFDKPVQGVDGRFRVPGVRLLPPRGGHCFPFEPITQPDTIDLWGFYDQAKEGACEGFGNSRVMSWLNGGRKFDAFWLYDDAQRIEGTYLPNGGSADDGSTNDAAAQALHKWGDHPADRDGNTGEVIVRVSWRGHIPSVGIASYHWATSVDEIRTALGYDSSVGEFGICNSWGRDGYPHRVYFPDTAIDWMIQNGAEFTILVPKS